MADAGKYRKYALELGLSEEQCEQWVGTIERIADNLLTKKFMLESDSYEKARKTK